MKKILSFIIAIIISTFIFPLGFIFNIFNIWNFKEFLKYYLKLTIEVCKVICNFFEKIAIFLDILGNVIAGRLFFYSFVKKGFRKDNTYFGVSEWTISASIGHLQYYKRLNKFGLWFSNLLTILIDKNHCINAYNWKIYKDKFKRI